MSEDPLRSDLAEGGFVPARYVLSAVVYLERDDEILLLKRAEGSALAGQWFLPGGMVEAGELPEDGLRRELREEAGLEVDGPLELIGAYPIHVYGYDTLQLSYRGRAAAGEAAISHEHDDVRWARAADVRALLTDDVIADISGGRPAVASILQHVRADLDRYLGRIAERAADPV